MWLLDLLIGIYREASINKCYWVLYDWMRVIFQCMWFLEMTHSYISGIHGFNTHEYSHKYTHDDLWVTHTHDQPLSVKLRVPSSSWWMAAGTPSRLYCHLGQHGNHVSGCPCSNLKTWCLLRPYILLCDRGRHAVCVCMSCQVLIRLWWLFEWRMGLMLYIHWTILPIWGWSGLGNGGAALFVMRGGPWWGAIPLYWETLQVLQYFHPRLTYWTSTRITSSSLPPSYMGLV